MVSYEQSLKRLFACGTSPKLGLDRMRALLADLGNPERQMKIFHVAGTNGKGSACAYIDAMLGEAGIRRGLYTSPHLNCARERIRINGQMVSEEDWVAAEQRVGLDGTFFERLTAMALLIFAEKGVEVAVLEVGLGGRLDATNVVTPIVCGITQIDLDHTAILGDTIEAITREKAGIIKAGIPVVTDMIEGHVKPYLPESIQPGLLGLHQHNNAAIAWKMIDVSGLIPDFDTRKRGIENAKWPGRYEIVCNDPVVILDGAHNPGGLRTLVANIRYDKPIIVVVGMTDGHAHREMAQILETLTDKIYVCQAKAPRACPSSELMSVFSKNAREISSVEEAVRAAIEEAKKISAYVIVTGSLYVVGEARALFFDVPCDVQMPLW